VARAGVRIPVVRAGVRIVAVRAAAARPRRGVAGRAGVPAAVAGAVARPPAFLVVGPVPAVLVPAVLVPAVVTTPPLADGVAGAAPPGARRMPSRIWPIWSGVKPWSASPWTVASNAARSSRPASQSARPRSGRDAATLAGEGRMGRGRSAICPGDGRRGGGRVRHPTPRDSG